MLTEGDAAASAGPCVARAIPVARRRLHDLARLLIATGILACGGSSEATVPSVGDVRVTVATTGGDIDIDGYDVIVDTLHRRIFPGTTAISVRTSAGTHTVTIDSVAANCTVSGERSRAVTVSAAAIADVRYDVGCLATGVEIRTRTTGPDNPPTFDVMLDDRYAVPVNANGSVVVSRLAVGTHTVTLGLRVENCTMPANRQVSVAVALRVVTPIDFDVTCTTAVRRPRIAFVVDTVLGGIPRTRWVMLMNPDGSDVTALAPGDNPAWSPDGTRLAFTNSVCRDYDFYYGYPCPGGIVVMDPERWTTTSVPGTEGGFGPAWSRPSGDIVFNRCCRYNERGQLIVATADGKVQGIQPFRVTLASDPVFSPDGQRILFTCTSTGSNNSDICLVNRNNSDLVQLTNSNNAESNPAWRPDGAQIVFTRQPPGTLAELIIADADGSNPRTLTQGDEATWINNGAQLLFSGFDGIFRINADGTQRTRLTKGNQRAPALRP